jgi:glycosyltransferase involved in cell wall biosynthesis
MDPSIPPPPAAAPEGPLVTCIVPVFNGERYLGEALDSTLAQTYRPLEIIVADDGSTDGTAALAATYGDRVRYLRQDNAGPAAARNLGLGAARGEFVPFLDADDLWHPEKLTRQMARFEARPDLEMCVTHIRNFYSPDLNTTMAAPHRDSAHLTREIPGYLTQTLLARRSFFHAIGGFDCALRHSNDTEWFIRAAEHAAAMELLPDTLLYRRVHRTNLSRLEAEDSREEYLNLVKARLDRRRRLVGRDAHQSSRAAVHPHAS